MADNIATTPGSGATIAADDVGGVLHQRVKIGLGGDGTAADLMQSSGLGDGNDGANLLPAGNYLYDSVGGLWARVRGPVGDTLAVTGLQADAPMLYNGATFDRQRGNLEGTLLASAARTATTSTTVQTNYNHRGVHLTVVVTVAGTGNLDILLVGNPLSAATYIMGSIGGSGITGTGNWVLEGYPGIGAAGSQVNARFSTSLPRSWYASVTHSNASSWTYALYYSLIL